MKHFITVSSALFLASALTLSPVCAAECGRVIASDGNLCSECELGDFGADAIRSETGADLAFFASGDLGISLQPGAVTEQTIADSFPYDKDIVVITVTKEELTALLEENFSCFTLNEYEEIDQEASADPDFFCISGFTCTCDASAPIGDRLYELNLQTEQETYTVALSSDYAEGETVCTIRQAVTDYVNACGTVEPPDGDRIHVIGANANRIIGGYLPRWFVVLMVVVVLIFSGGKYRRRLRTER